MQHLFLKMGAAMSKPLLVANWKMNGYKQTATSLLQAIRAGFSPLAQKIDCVICPGFLHIDLAHQILKETSIQVGGQNHYLGMEGAFTGEISANQLIDAGCQYVILGHSERRQYFSETSELIAQKSKVAIDAGLFPIICVGETQEERAHQQTEIIIAKQLAPLFQVLNPADFSKFIIAYEPIWAIGTGLSASPEDADAVHQFIRGEIQEHIDLEQHLRILYGGSVKPDNATELFSMPNIDGALVGGASLNADSFLKLAYLLAEQKRESF